MQYFYVDDVPVVEVHLGRPVVDMPNDSDCKQWKCLKIHRRQRQWHVAPGSAGFAFRAAFSTIAGRCSFSAWSWTRPLRTTTWVVVQTVQFLDKVVAMPIFRQVQFLGKVVDTPVVFNDRGHGPDSAVPGPLLLLGKVVDTPVVYNDRGYGPDSAFLGPGAVTRQGR